jgi:isoleucyl-tRNA synthetase
MGADLMRWIFCCQNPVLNLNFGYHMAAEFKRKLLTLHNVYSFYITYAKLDGFNPAKKDLSNCKLSLLDRWILSELNLLVKEARENLDQYQAAPVCKRAEAFIEDLSTWYVRRSRRRFWKSESDSDKEAAYLTLHTCLETLLRALAPIMPFWTEEMYQNLVRSADATAPESVHLADYPRADQSRIDQQLSDEMALVRKVVSMGHAARKDSKMKVRQPLARILYAGKDNQAWEMLFRYKDIIQEEVNVKELELITDLDSLIEYRAKGLISKLGPKFGPKAKAAGDRIGQLDNAAVKKLKTGGKLDIDLDGSKAEILAEDAEITTVSKSGMAVKQEGEDCVALDVNLTRELTDEGHARELVHAVQNIRKESGFEVSDRIKVSYHCGPELQPAVDKFRTYITNETLALELKTGLPETAGHQMKINGHPINLVIKKANS